MQRQDEQIHRGLAWLTEFGLGEADLRSLNPCVPGEFMLDTANYVNSATPHVVYRGAGEGTLPLVAGRWYMIPSSLSERYPRLRQDTVPVARAPRLIPS
jgi:hypothetical protein